MVENDLGTCSFDHRDSKKSDFKEERRKAKTKPLLGFPLEL